MKYPSYVVFFLLFGALPDVFWVLQPGIPWLWKGLLCLPTLAALVSLVLIGLGIRYTEALRVFSYLIFICELPKLLSLITPVLGIAVSAFFLIVIFYVSRHLKVNRLELAFEGLPEAFDGLRIAQLTDLHLGSFGKGAKYVNQVVDTALDLSPDLMLFTGDLVNFVSSEAEPYMNELSRLKAPLGVFAIRGNHDYLLHGPHDEDARQADMEKLLALEKGLGWHVLLNEHVLLHKDGADIALVGVENVSSNPYFKKMGGNLNKATEGLPEGVFTILLSHDPSHWRAEVVPSSDIPLTLSGHTHGLKYKTAGLNPRHWTLPHSHGVYLEGKQVLHVSKGLGSAFAFRLGGFPQIDIITLKTQKLN